MLKAGDVRKGFEKRRDLGRAERDQKVKIVRTLFRSRMLPSLTSSTTPAYQLFSLAKPRMKFLSCKSDPVASMLKLFSGSC